MLDKFTETVNRYKLLRKNDLVLVGVSGGPDSLALLFKLSGLKRKLNLRLHIAHFDHGWRKDSGQDALFVENLGKKLKIPVTVGKLRRQSKPKGSLEEFFRLERIEFLLQTAKKVGADKIALGHNLNDQAETVLMRILRGTGLSGLSAIFPKRTIGKTVFIRPLLETPRSLIEKFLKGKGLSARIDPSNGRDFFMRNKIRHRLLPELKQSYNKNIINLLANLAQSAADDYQYLEQAAHNSLKGSPSRLNLKKLAKLHPAILRLKLRQGIAAVQGDTRRISFVHIRELEDLISDRPHGSIVHLPKRICVQKTRTYLRFYKR